MATFAFKAVDLSGIPQSGEIDGALVAKPSEREPWKGVAHLAQTREDVIACAGSFYNPNTLTRGNDNIVAPLAFLRGDLRQRRIGRSDDSRAGPRHPSRCGGQIGRFRRPA